MTHAPDATSRPAAAPPTAPLGALAAVIFLNSVGTGAVTSGVYFITTEQYGYSSAQNLALALLMGASYVAGALGVAPLLRTLARRSARVTTRRVFVGLTLFVAALCCVPPLVKNPWSVWLLVGLYGPASGAMWPIVESYLSGGRRDRELRRVIGVFNITWALAVMLAFWGLGPMLKLAPLLALAALGVVHLATLPFVLRQPPEPARHLGTGHGPHPRVYEPLLRVFRWLLILSYVLLSAVAPVLPERMRTFEVAVAWSAPLASAWAASRICMFWLLSRWHGWHGRWRTPVWTGGAMLAGVALALKAPTMPLFMVGLALFGVGLGGVYTAALYYAMAVGAAAVDAGGKHEALIGGGYTIGPLAGLLGWWLHDTGRFGLASHHEGTLWLVGGVTLLIVLLAARSARARRRPL